MKSQANYETIRAYNEIKDKHKLDCLGQCSWTISLGMALQNIKHSHMQRN